MSEWKIPLGVVALALLLAGVTDRDLTEVARLGVSRGAAQRVAKRYL